MAHRALSSEDSTDHVWAHLDASNQKRIAVILREQIPELFRLNRIIEQQTGYSSEIGKNMLVDVLSHLGTLAQRHDLTPEQEASQLSKIEEHVRRAIIEHPEEVVRMRLVDVRERWSTYNREAFPYREQGLLVGAPRHLELEELRRRIGLLLEAARTQKPNETTWDESLDAAADMTEAAHLTQELADKLEQCIGVARRIAEEAERDTEARRQHRRRDLQWVVGLIVAGLLAASGWAVAYSLSKDDPPPASAFRQTEQSTSSAPARTGPRAP